MYLNRRPVQVLDDAAVEEDVPEPEPQEDDPEPWDEFMERIRRQELEHDRVRGVRRVGIWDPVMQRYNIRDEE